MTRQVLSLRPRAESALAPVANDPRRDVAELDGSESVAAAAVAGKRNLRGRYNGGEVVLQPSLLYREHGALFLLAVTVRRDGKPPREPKLGNFRLVGLSGLGVTDDMFVPGALHRGYNVNPGWDVLAAL